MKSQLTSSSVISYKASSIAAGETGGGCAGTGALGGAGTDNDDYNVTRIACGDRT